MTMHKQALVSLVPKLELNAVNDFRKEVVGLCGGSFPRNPALVYQASTAAHCGADLFDLRSPYLERQSGVRSGQA